MSDFDISTMFSAPSVIDQVLGDPAPMGRQAAGTSMRDLTDQARAKNAFPVKEALAGTRVSFIANLGSVLSYARIPGDGVEGTIVTVRTADGDASVWDGRVMVAWDDGLFLPVHPEHLRKGTTTKRRANAFRMVLADLGNLADFFGTRHGGDDLIHKATKDLWSFRSEGDNFVIERLFDEGGHPLKV
jgi:hypothetical protein